MLPPDNETYRKVLELVFARADATNVYWNIYIAVALGVLGLMASGKPFTSGVAIKCVLSIGFLAFAYSNYDAIAATNLQRTELIKLLASSNLLSPALYAEPAKAVQLAWFHGLLDLLVVALVWLVPWHRSSAPPDSAA